MFNHETDHRFKIVYEQGINPSYKIILDTVTGINYMLACGENFGGLTPLLDKDGKSVITPLEK